MNESSEIQKEINKLRIKIDKLTQKKEIYEYYKYEFPFCFRLY